MDSTIVVVLAVLISLGVGALAGFSVWKLLSVRRYGIARDRASEVLDEARNEQRQVLLEAKEEAHTLRSSAEEEAHTLRSSAEEEAHTLRSSAETEHRDRRAEYQRTEQRLSNREENVERRANNVDRREGDLTQKESDLQNVRSDLDTIKQQRLEELETISNLTSAEAKNELMNLAEEEAKLELAIRYRDMEELAKEEANDKARNIISLAISRLASDVVSEVSLTTVPLPTDEMKGRLIGREGRNIRAIEKATGVDLIIDETPEAVTLSCFDPIRREVARIAVGKLVADGRIHPARIEEMVSKTQKELQETIRKTGSDTITNVGVRGVNTDLTMLMGRLKYRFSYGENVLQHSVEVGHLAAAMAAEIGADVKRAKLGGLLHDIGKALTHEVEGPHAEIGADVAAKANIPAPIVAAIREHHDDDHSSPESFLVAAADAISAARPGSRRDTVEHYIKRLEALEDVARAFDGVEKCYAIQAGREVRIIVKPQSIDDHAADQMARDVVRKIEETLNYPGQIKVTVIRESRSVEYAR